jgi:hypothetical protein
MRCGKRWVFKGSGDLPRYRLGNRRWLHAIDSGELGEIAGKRLIHLQCHFGLDTLILAREGAVATGLDFSLAAIEARRLAAQIGVDFVHEHPWLPWPPFPMCVPTGNGAYCLPKGAPSLPLAVSLRAVKNRIART